MSLVRVGVTPSDPLTSSGTEIAVHERATAARQVRAVVVPALDVRTDAALARRFAEPDWRDAVGWVREQERGGAVIAAGASAVFVLAQAKLLEGRRCTTSSPWLSTLRRMHPDAIVDPTRSLTESGGLVCAGTVLGHVEMAVAVVREVVGATTAAAVAAHYRSDVDVDRWDHVVRDAGPRHRDAVKAEVWVRENLSRRFAVAELARAVGVSERTLSRRLADSTGMSPRAFVQRIRIRRAAHLLRHSSLAVEDIAAAVGHRDASQLRRVFRRLIGSSPSEYRRSTD